MTNDVVVCEVGPRDGLQMANTVMPTAIKRRSIDAMAQAGVPDIGYKQRRFHWISSFATGFAW